MFTFNIIAAEWRINMNEKALIMKTEIRSISGYRSLIISRISLSICLTASAFYVGILGYPSSPVYILLMLNLLPSILSYIFKDCAKKYKKPFFQYIIEDPVFNLRILKKKYHYSRLGYITNSLSFIIALILLIFWQYYCNTLQTLNLFIIYQPTLIIITNVLIRFFCIFLYRIKLPFDLSHNRI